MALRDCINQFISNKEIRNRLLGIKDDEKLKVAFNHAMRNTKRELTVQKATASKMKKVKDRVDLSVETEGYTPYNAGMDEISLGTVRGEMRGTSLEDDVFAIKGELYREMGDVVDNMKTKSWGASRNQNTMRDVVKEWFDEKPSSFKASKEAKKYSDQLKKSFEKGRKMINDALGEVDAVKFMTDYIPTFEAIEKMKPENFGKWFTDVQNYADVDRIIDTIHDKEGILDGMSRQQKLGTELVEGAFRAIFEAKGSGGLTKVDYGRKGGTQIPSRFTHDKVLVFKNGENWLKYDDIWGSPEHDIMGSIHGTFEGYARDIAAIRKFGHDPEAGIKEMIDHIGRVTYKGGGDVDKVKADHIEGAYNHLMGNMHSSGTNPGKVLSGMRQLQTTKLVAAPITAAFGDSFTMAMAGKMSGLNNMRMMKDLVTSLFNSKETLKDAVNIGLNADYAVGHARHSMRFFEASGYGFPDKVGNFMTRVTGLNMWTNLAKITYQREVLQSLANRVDMPYHQINKETRDLLSRHGITEADWEKIKTGVKTNNGSSMIDPRELDFESRQKLLAAISSDTRLAIMEPTAKAREFAYGSAKSGTFGGEARRAVMQFKMHGLSFFMTTVSRGLYAKNINKFGYLGVNAVGLTGMGALMIWTSDLAKGKTPRDWKDPRFLWESIVRGGSAGVLGDVFDSALSYRGLASSLAGPVVSDLDKLATYMFGTVKDVENFVFKETAGQITADALEKTVANVWYARIVTNRMLTQGIRQMTDPNYKRKVREQSRRMKKEKGQEYWIGPK